MNEAPALWTYDAFLAATGGRPLGARPETLAGISIDSRTLEAGEAFFAIAGDRFDGHDFASRSLARGAATAVVDEGHLAALGRTKGSLTVVPDVMDALRGLAAAGRARAGARIAAITGSVGKTTTKEMLAAALAPDGAVHFSPASFNNHWGVPLTLARMPADAAYGVFEIGMNHAGEITPLTRMVRPHVAIVTTVAPVHLEYFKDIKGVARAKAEIFKGVVKDGAAILNRDNEHYAQLARAARATGIRHVFGFGEHERADVRLETARPNEACSYISASVFGEPVSYKLGAPGRHLIQNSLAVLAAVSVMGADLAKAMLALAAYDAGAGRGQQVPLALSHGRGTATLIDESYNANPASMRAAIAVLGQSKPDSGGHRVAVLGDMLELGKESAAHHADLADALAEADIDQVFLAGRHMQALWDALPRHRQGGYAPSAAELEPLIASALAPGDVVMVKGSNASRMGPLVAALKARFSAAGVAGEPRSQQETA